MKILGITSGFITAYVLYKTMFSDRDEFFECIKYWFTPDFINALKGQYWESTWAEFKIVIWIAISVAVGYGVSNF